MSRRGSIRRRFVVGSIASALVALVLFAAGSFAVVLIDDDAEAEIRDGHDSYRAEATEIILGAMAVAAPLALLAAAGMAVVMSRRSARPLEDAIRAARETTTHDLRRTLPVPVRQDELRELVVALNELFARLDDGFAALARFAADASHELRTPLAVIGTELEVALRHPRSADAWQATARTSLDEVRRLSALIEGLLTLARADAGAPAPQPVQLVECADAVVAQLAAAAERAEVALVALVAPDAATAGRVRGSAVMLETALRNLVENALAAAPRGGRVRISVADGPATSWVFVDDDGPGLGADPEALFAPFHRGGGGHGRGVGLGLAIARRVAVAHGGTLTTAASPLGGARFVLEIPRDRA